MKYLAIFDSFKGTLKSRELGELTVKYLNDKDIIADYLIISDGGDGFLEAISATVKMEEIFIETFDPFRRPIVSSFGLKGDVAYIEMASSVGINRLTKKELNPLIASSYGFGIVINEAIKRSAKKIILGIGGSATNDGGAGMLEALGVKFYTKGKIVTNLNNEKLANIDYIDYSLLENKFLNVEIEVICDVNNPLLGKNGATYVYGPQKGATKETLSIIENNIACFAKLFNDEEIEYKGSGAAGGVGWALKMFLNAKFNPGIDYFLNIIDYEKKIEDYDVIITGEGKFDKSSLNNKTVIGIANHTKNKQIIIIAGSSTINNYIYPIYPLVPDIASLEEALANPKDIFLKRLKKIDFK